MKGVSLSITLKEVRLLNKLFSLLLPTKAFKSYSVSQKELTCSKSQHFFTPELVTPDQRDPKAVTTNLLHSIQSTAYQLCQCSLGFQFSKIAAYIVQQKLSWSFRSFLHQELKNFVLPLSLINFRGSIMFFLSFIGILGCIVFSFSHLQ